MVQREPNYPYAGETDYIANRRRKYSERTDQTRYNV